MPSVGGRAEAAAVAAATVSGRPRLDDLTSRSSAVQVGGDVRGTAIAVIWKYGLFTRHAQYLVVTTPKEDHRQREQFHKIRVSIQDVTPNKCGLQLQPTSLGTRRSPGAKWMPLIPYCNYSKMVFYQVVWASQWGYLSLRIKPDPSPPRPLLHRPSLSGARNTRVYVSTDIENTETFHPKMTITLHGCSCTLYVHDKGRF